jgi:hypothetical protein
MSGDVQTAALVAFFAGVLCGALAMLLVAVGSIERHLNALENDRPSTPGSGK